MSTRRVGFLGPRGTFSEEAAVKYAHRTRMTLVPFSSIYELMDAVNHGRVREGVVPIENSVEGAVSTTLDLLVQMKFLRIRQEIDLPVVHHLIAPRGTRLTDITEIVSHPQALAQCQGFLRKKLPKARATAALSTAEAVAKVASHFMNTADHVVAAIGSLHVARLYRLSVIAPSINDFKNNVTRFVVVGKTTHPAAKNCKTSIAFSTFKDKPGSLYAILAEFASRKINLTKIESRPEKNVLGEYIFFVDCEGHHSQPRVKDAIRALRQKTSFFRILGSYPRMSSS